VNLEDGAFDRRAVSARSQNQWVREVRARSLSLRVGAHQPQHVPQLLPQNVKPQFVHCRNHCVVRILRYCVHFFQRDCVDFVVDVEALHVLPIAFDAIDEVVDVVVAPEVDVSVVDLVLLEDVLDHLLVDLGELCIRVEHNSSSLLDLDRNVWSLLVESDADVFEFPCELLLVFFSLLSIEHHHYQV